MFREKLVKLKLVIVSLNNAKKLEITLLM